MRTQLQLALDAFLTKIAEANKIAPESLSLVARLCNGGPSVGPGSLDGAILKTAEASIGKGVDSLPSPWYDTLKQNYIDYQIVQKIGEGKVQIPKMLYAWQHHVQPGNCRICVNRWVRVGDGKFTKKLLVDGLRFRAAVASFAAQTKTMVITTGHSFSGAEQFDRFTELYKNSTHKILCLDLDKFLGSDEAEA